jgi:hypothetical protein
MQEAEIWVAQVYWVNRKDMNETKWQIQWVQLNPTLTWQLRPLVGPLGTKQWWIYKAMGSADTTSVVRVLFDY